MEDMKGISTINIHKPYLTNHSHMFFLYGIMGYVCVTSADFCCILGGSSHGPTNRWELNGDFNGSPMGYRCRYSWKFQRGGSSKGICKTMVMTSIISGLYMVKLC